MSNPYTVEELQALLPYCKTETQSRTLQAVIEHGSSRKAASALGVNKSSINENLVRVRKYAASKGWAPNHGMVFPAPDPFTVKRVSTLRNAEGDITAQWVISEPERLSIEHQLQELISAFRDDLPTITPTPAPKVSDKDLIPWLNIGDAHLGMLASAAEVGADFNLEIAETELCKAISVLIDRLPATDRIVLCDLGDMTHTEVNSNRTEASGHSLDVDGRFYKIFRVYLRTMRYMITYALTKYTNVDVIINQGNHSRTNDIAMATFLTDIYSSEPRVNILDNTNVFIPYRMGNTFIMTHHGDKTRMDRLTNVMVSDYKDQMDAKYKYIYTGHIHNNKVLAESHGIVVESFNQLASPDKYAHEGGWRSRKCITAILLSKTYGEKGRITLTAEEVKDMVSKLPSGTTPALRTEVYSV